MYFFSNWIYLKLGMDLAELVFEILNIYSVYFIFKNINARMGYIHVVINLIREKNTTANSVVVRSFFLTCCKLLLTESKRII